MAIDNNANFTPTIPDSGVVPVKSPYNPTGSFKFWAQKVLPLVYDDSLSYYEVLCKVVNYLNNVIQNIDNLNDSVNSTNQSFETLKEYVNTTKDTLINTYNELQDYVNTYFDNLDVQQEINAKLDAMADSGELTNLLAPFIPNLVTQWLNNHVTPTSPIIDNTLSISRAGADAKVTGDKFSELKENLEDFGYQHNKDFWMQGMWAYGSGKYVDLSTYICSKTFVPDSLELITSEINGVSLLAYDGDEYIGAYNKTLNAFEIETYKADFLSTKIDLKEIRNLFPQYKYKLGFRTINNDNISPSSHGDKITLVFGAVLREDSNVVSAKNILSRMYSAIPMNDIEWENAYVDENGLKTDRNDARITKEYYPTCNIAIAALGKRTRVVYYNYDPSSASYVWVRTSNQYDIGSTTTVSKAYEYCKIEFILYSTSDTIELAFPVIGFIPTSVSIKYHNMYLTTQPNSTIYFERNNRDIYFTFSGEMYLREQYSFSGTITSMGLSLVTSPLGVTNCIKLGHNNVLVFDINTRLFKIVLVNEITANYIPILYCAYGVIVGGIGQYLYERFKYTSLVVKYNNVYLATQPNSTIYFEKDSRNIYFKFSGEMYLRGGYLFSGAITSMGVSLVTSPLGVTDCIKLDHNNVLVFDVNTRLFKIVLVNEITANYIPILYCAFGVIVGGIGQYLYERFNYTSNEEVLPNYWITYLEEKKDSIKQLVEECDDTFFFVTDVHTPTNLMRSPSIIKYIQSKIDIPKVIVGGDYETSASSRRLGLDQIDRWMEKADRDWLQVRGNHDTNYQGTGEVTAKDFYSHAIKPLLNNVTVMSDGTPVFYQDDVNSKLRYIFLDTISENTPDISDQVTWMKDKISELPSGWSVIVFTHIYFKPKLVSSGATELPSSIVGDQIKSGLDEIYDSSNATIIALICGHCHRDYNISTNAGYPIISTTCDAYRQASDWDLNYPTRTAGTITEQAIDIYGIDKTNRIIKTIRIGAGAENRSFSF